MKGLSNRIKFRMKLWKMDSLRRFTGGHANSLFPPSFYYTHTEEEIKKAVDEAVRPLEKILEEKRASICNKEQHNETNHEQGI